jgi:hypothetical protein
MAPPKKKRVFKLDDLAFYFDAVERDQIDGGGVSRRNAELLALRDGLLRLDDAAFDATMRTMRSLVENALRPPLASGEAPRQRRAEAQRLYETAQPALPPAPGKGHAS